jgi:hypothetical protein
MDQLKEMFNSIGMVYLCEQHKWGSNVSTLGNVK